MKKVKKIPIYGCILLSSALSVQSTSKPNPSDEQSPKTFDLIWFDLGLPPPSLPKFYVEDERREF